MVCATYCIAMYIPFILCTHKNTQYIMSYFVVKCFKSLYIVSLALLENLCIEIYISLYRLNCTMDVVDGALVYICSCSR